ncbi:hypothetical protein FSP39_023218 [Pinctada imbricata]|uniref:General transcription factor 3C polypeptide 5 n=1 Tax=Pinctada imbricata TaxID=66713 RepID=A0AA88XX29_PINIB|nr:hypothetical protein FSP39_023218 [Pinctada imbricata]
MNTDEQDSEERMTDSDRRMKVSFNKHRKFICVEYPGIVENTEMAIKSLGGVENLSEIYSDETKRLPLQWRPDDIFSKPAYGERNLTTNLLLKVKVRRRKSTKEICQCSTEVLGTVGITYKFKGLADFQYLPVEEKKGKQVQFLDKLVVERMEDRKEFLNRDVPLYLPPISFCRTDAPDKDYQFRPEIIHRPGFADPASDRPSHLIGPSREVRSNYTVFINYGDKIPQGNSEIGLKKLRLRLKSCESKEEEIDRLFQIRPIWSRFAISNYYSSSKASLKYLLPMKAYYCLTGPWRCMWIKFGFDPTKDPETKKYQIIDFRMRQSMPTGNFGIERKRGFNFQMFTAKNRKSLNSTLINPATIAVTLGRSQKEEESEEGGSKVEKETEEQVGKHIFLPDRLPYCRQIFYQIMDIREPEIQKILNSFTSKVCSAKSGWFSMHQIVKVRDIMTNHIRKLLIDKGMYFWPPSNKQALSKIRNQRELKENEKRLKQKQGIEVSDTEDSGKEEKNDRNDEEEDDGNEVEDDGNEEEDFDDGNLEQEREMRYGKGQMFEEEMGGAPGVDLEAEEEMEFEQTFTEVNHDILEFL